MFKKILIAVDGGTPASRAIQAGVELAGQLRAAIGALHVVDPAAAIHSDAEEVDPKLLAKLRAEAKRLGLTGRVGLECSIDMNGHAQNITISDATNSLLDKHAAALLSSGHFDLPDDWVTTGGPERRYRIGVIFELTNKPSVPKFEDGRTTFTVRGSGIP